MIVYLPHYDNGEETCNNSHGVSDKAYTSLEDAIQEVKELGYVIQEDKSDEIELMGFPDIEINSEILPFVFYKEPFERYKKTPTYSFDDREFAFINKIELVEGETGD
ncbi:ABC-type oligopeptide transport system substrate-binding subunit [Staphylococcus epidermidis]